MSNASDGLRLAFSINAMWLAFTPTRPPIFALRRSHRVAVFSQYLSQCVLAHIWYSLMSVHRNFAKWIIPARYFRFCDSGYRFSNFHPDTDRKCAVAFKNRERLEAAPFAENKQTAAGLTV